MRTSSIRFTGMASGMDTDSIVKDMLRPQQYKIDNQKKAQALLKLKQDAWKDMNKKLFDFHMKYTDKMRFEGTFNKSVTNSSNENIMSIDKKATVPAGSHTFEVENLATSAMAVGKVDKQFDKDGKPVSRDITLNELAGGKFSIPDHLTMRVNGEEIKIKVSEKDKLSDVAKRLNDKFKEEEVAFTAKYDEANGGFFISSIATGEDQTIKFSTDNKQGAKLFAKLGLDDTTGKNAKYSYNGVSDFESATNNIEINGIKATLKAAGEVTITSQQDPGAVYDFIKEFVTDYNKLIDEINLKTGTKPGKDMKPLTAEERKGMSDSEIELWEERINNSLFYKDPLLTDFADSARKILGQLIGEGEGAQSLAKYGIVTGSWEEKGKLHIQGDEDFPTYVNDTNKLKEALEKSPESLKEVTSFFHKLGKDLYEDHNKKLMSSNELKSAMNFYNDKVMTKEMQRFDKEISTLEERLYRLEEMHYRKFAAMEKMLSSLNNQSSWLAQQFGGY